MVYNKNKSKKFILVAEDDEMLLKAICLQLKDDGYNISSVTDGESVMSAVEKTHPNLIILDLILPGIDGFEVLRLLNAHVELKKIPVLVLSNLGDDHSKERAKDFGVKYYHVKSDTKMQDLSDAVNKILK